MSAVRRHEASKRENIIKKVIDGVRHVFSLHRNEQNSPQLRKDMTNEVMLLLSLQRHIHDFRVKCDEENNPHAFTSNGIIFMLVELKLMNFDRIIKLTFKHGPGHNNMFRDQDYDRAMSILEPR